MDPCVSVSITGQLTMLRIGIRIHCHVLTVVWMRYMELSGSQPWICDLGITIYQFRCKIVIKRRL